MDNIQQVLGMLFTEMGIFVLTWDRSHPSPND